MGFAVCNGATCQCSFGMAPGTLVVLPQNRILVGTPMANIMDYKPIVNIQPFGMCNSLSNPQVAAATSAALGVLTPQPCIPNTVSPWVPGSPTVLVAGQPALNNNSKLMCAWGGMIQILNPGQQKTLVP